MAGGGDLKVHVSINGHKVALVFHAPLELGNDRLAGQVVKEWLGIDRNLHEEKGRGACRRASPVMQLGKWGQVGCILLRCNGVANRG